MTGADSLAQTVRDAVDYGVWSSRRAPALRALDELVGRLDQAERYEREEQELAARLRQERDEALELLQAAERENAALRELLKIGSSGRELQLEREKAALREALEATGRELERVKDVRVNRTTVIGNAYMIVTRALASSGPAPEGTTEAPARQAQGETYSLIEEALAAVCPNCGWPVRAPRSGANEKEAG